MVLAAILSSLIFLISLVLISSEKLNRSITAIAGGVLIFFVALFVMVGGLEASGVLESIVSLFRGASSVQPVLFGILLIWLVAALWWALAFGAGFGGNGTIIGSTANIIVAILSEKTRSPITSRLWIRRGLPVMLRTCVIASILYAIFYGSF